MTKFDHNGVEIQLASNGKFMAIINGKTVRGATLDGMKKKIDNAGKTEFAPFSALRDKYGEIVEVKVLGVKAPRKGSRWYRNHHEFILDNGTEEQKLMEDTPENRALYAEIRAFGEETDRIKGERVKQKKAMEERLTYIHADNFAPKKPANGSGE